MTKQQKIDALIKTAQAELKIIMEDVTALNTKLNAAIKAINNG